MLLCRDRFPLDVSRFRLFDDWPGCSSAWQSACFGSRRPLVQIQSPRFARSGPSGPCELGAARRSRDAVPRCGTMTGFPRSAATRKSVTPMNNSVHQGRVVHWGETDAPARLPIRSAQSRCALYRHEPRGTPAMPSPAFHRSGTVRSCHERLGITMSNPATPCGCRATLVDHGQRHGTNRSVLSSRTR